MSKTVELQENPAGPLVGVRVLDLSRLVAGNFLTMLLADIGADVIKVEPPSGDTLRDWTVADVPTAWKSYCRNKRSLCLNLRSIEAQKIILDLAAESDVFVESFRPGTLEQMGLAPDTLLARNPSLVIVRISGWGQTGPYRDRPGFGTLVEGISGFASMNGFPDREPVLPPIYLGDMTAGLYGAMGALAALRNVEVNGGKGQVIDLPLLDPLFAILGPQAANHRITDRAKERTGSRSTNSAPRNVYKTFDDKWVCLSASTQSMAKRLFGAIGRPDLIDDPRFMTNTSRLQHVNALDKILADFISTMPQVECVEYFAGFSVTVGPIFDIVDITKDKHFEFRGIVVDLPDPQMGTIPVHNILPRFSATPGAFTRIAPALGENTRDILKTLGYSAKEIEELESVGVVKSTEAS
jgi:crotonobetainyl-CoA:carnitine CoA-transferase CaiB-like acyl-CoA transferase